MSRGRYTTIAISVLVFALGFGVLPMTNFAQEAFQDGFESGDFRNWSWVHPGPSSVTINSDPRFVRSGRYSARIHYVLPASGEAHLDNNSQIGKSFPGGLDHLMLSGYVYHGTPLNPNIQRKLIYYKDPGSSNQEALWSGSLTSHNFQLAFAPQTPSDSAFRDGDYNVSWNLYSLEPNRWYKVEFELKANTPGLRDGYVNVWVDGTHVLNRTNMNLRGNLTTKITRVEIGRQVDRFNFIPVDEDRYWDDITIIGQSVGASTSTKPAAPTGLRVQ